MTPTKQELLALLRNAASVIRNCESFTTGVFDPADECEPLEAAAAAIEEDLRRDAEVVTRRLTENRALVGRFFKDRHADMRSFDFTSKTMLYRAVVGCDENAQLRCWSFVRDMRGAVIVETNDRGALFGAAGEEITAEEFYAAAAEVLTAIIPLLGWPE